MSECLRCGFCCRQGPCPFGEWADGQCRFLVAQGLGFVCARYESIRGARGADIAPAFGAGCGSRLFNDEREVAVFLRHYVTTAIWASELDGHDLAPETVVKMRDDCCRFHVANRQHYTNIGHAAHDFWLTRCGHGAGYWDGDYPEPAATILTRAAHAFGECDLYVGDDGLIHIS